MNKIARRLERLTTDFMGCKDFASDEGKRLTAELSVYQELAKTNKEYDSDPPSDRQVRDRLILLTNNILAEKQMSIASAERYVSQLKALSSLIKTITSVEGIEVKGDEAEAERKSSKKWDAGPGSLSTEIKITLKQTEALAYLDSGQFDKFLALGGSGSGKSFILAYKAIRDALRHKAPCLIGRNALVDLTQGMIDQIIPVILGMIAQTNGQDDWKKWKIDGLSFAKWTDKKTKLEFATGGYVRCAGLSARDLSESGSDKILSPSWLHIMLEEVSELEYETVEKVITRLRYNVDGVLNVLMMCENPPSINHWSYKRFFEHKREDGTFIDEDEKQTMHWLLMNPKDNVENLGETYIKNLSHMTGANYERFYLGQFQDTEQGTTFKKMHWVDPMPKAYDYERLVIYTDPTPLIGKEYSKWADYKASVLLGLVGEDTYIIDLRIVRGSTLDMLQSMKQLWDISPNHEITQIVMEKKQVPSDFRQVMQQYAAKTGWTVPITMDTRHMGEKKSSIETFLQPLFESELIHFNMKFKDTERGKQAQLQILKFSRKANKLLHDDIPDAIMRADTWAKNKKGKMRRGDGPLVQFAMPGFVHKMRM